MTGKEALEKARRANRKHKTDKMILDLLSECKQKLSEIKPQPEKSRWIPVTERLPSFEIERVLVAVDVNLIMGNPKMDTDRYLNGRWVRYGDHVTHWMPLPEPPKEGE